MMKHQLLVYSAIHCFLTIHPELPLGLALASIVAGGGVKVGDWIAARVTGGRREVFGGLGEGGPDVGGLDGGVGLDGNVGLDGSVGP